MTSALYQGDIITITEKKPYFFYKTKWINLLLRFGWEIVYINASLIKNDFAI